MLENVTNLIKLILTKEHKLAALSTQHSALSTQHKSFRLIYPCCIRWLILIGLYFFSFSAFAIQTCHAESLFEYGYYLPEGYIYQPTGYDYTGKPIPPLESCKFIEHRTFKVTNIVLNFAGPLYIRYACYGDFTFFDEITRRVETINGVGGATYCGCTETPSSTGFIPCSGLTLTLSPVPQTPPDPRPKGAEGKDGKSTLELVAKVMEGSAPKAGVAVTFAVEVAANSGGHDHHDATRPKGKVTANSPVTDTNGEIKVTFEASKVAGKHVVAAVCSSCSNSSVTKNVDVKVPDLVRLSEDSSVPPRFKLIGNTGSVGSKHLGNHYFSA